MPLSNRRRALYIIASVGIAFALWFYVNSTSEVDLSLYGVPVEFLNAESALANKGLVLMDGEKTTVDLVLTMPRDMVFGFDPNRLHLYANLNSVNSTGSQSITYSIAYPPGMNPNQISLKSPTVQTVSVRVGELFRKSDVEVRVLLVGSVADGYVAGEVQTSPATLEVWGQQSEVSRVGYAQVTLNIENATSTVSEQLEYSFFDESGEPLAGGSIHAANDTIQVTMPVICAREIPLTVRFLEEAGVRLGSFDYALDVEAITLAGDAKQLAALDELVLGEVALADLVGVEGESTFPFTISVPEGLTNLNGVTSATLTIANRDVAARGFTVTSFGYENFADDDRAVTVVTASLNVMLRGADETLAGVTPEQVSAVADLSDVANASGTYTVPAIIRVAGSPDVGAAQNYQLTVRISPRGEAAEENGT